MAHYTSKPIEFACRISILFPVAMQPTGVAAAIGINSRAHRPAAFPRDRESSSDSPLTLGQAQVNPRERRSAGDTSPAPEQQPAATPAALQAAGRRDLEAGRLLDAQLACERALALDPQHADSLHLMGLLCFRAQQYDHAVEWLVR